jgi:hypothetical protein
MYDLLNNYIRVYRRCKQLRKTIRKQLGLSKREIETLVLQLEARPAPRFIGVPNDPQFGD